MANETHAIDTNTERMGQKDASPAHGKAIPGIEEDSGAGHGPEPTALGLDATAWVSLAMILVFTVVQFRLQRRWVNYQ